MFDNPGFKLKQIQIKKIGILDFIIKFEFPDFSLLGEKFGDFWPQIRIPGEKLYIWSIFGQIWSKSSQIIKKNLGFFLIWT